MVAEDDVWVVDCGGLLTYREAAPPAAVVAGATVSGTAALKVDPFFYFERLAKREAMPGLIYDWQIERIELETTPWLHPATRQIVRDESRKSWREVNATDACNDDDGHAHYLLHCRRLPGQPRRQLHASG